MRAKTELGIDLFSAGMEVAAYLTDKSHSVSVIGIENIPFRKVLGEKVGQSIMKVSEGNRESDKGLTCRVSWTALFF